MKCIIKFFIITVILLLITISFGQGRVIYDKNKSTAFIDPYSNLCVTHQDINKMKITLQNNGIIGFIDPILEQVYDCLSGENVSMGSEYPQGSRLSLFRYIGLSVGAVLGTDTLVSHIIGEGFFHNTEFLPENSERGNFSKYSILNTEDKDIAISEQDIITTYEDTTVYWGWDAISGKYHKSLNIEVTQKCYGWSYNYAEDILLFYFEIKNIGKRKLKSAYVGLKFWPSNRYFSDHDFVFDQLCGFLKRQKSNSNCNYYDTLNLVWTANSSGRPYDGQFSDSLIYYEDNVIKSARHVLGTKFLNPKSDSYKFSFNWWGFDNINHYSFGPQTKEKFRIYGDGGEGFPYGDVNKYYMMSNGEIDYDQAFTSKVSKIDNTWMYPKYGLNFSKAYETSLYFMISQGPVDIPPGATYEFSFALVAGENFHIAPNNINNLPHNPDEYMSNVDFSDLAKNAIWASWIYDNPGIDTDGDGFYGKYRVCAIDSVETESGWIITKADTQFYEGDGVPDWRAAGPPPAPVFWLEPFDNSIRIRFNGERSETEKDFMTGNVDFEGYHIWMGRDERETSLSVIASYDLYNFDKYVFNKNLLPEPNYQLKDNPLTLEQLRCLYGNGCDDSLFNPLDYIRHDPYIHPDFPDSIFIFLPHHHNTSEFGVTTPITKVYPNAVNPNSIHPDSLTDIHYTEDGYFKYYEYQFIVNNLLPTVPYYFNVTAYDMGSPQTGLNPLETSKTLEVQFTYPLSPGTSLTDDNRKVYIYPNPYIIDAGYRNKSYEGRNREYLPNDKVRAIHFNNLPAKCVISIFTFDGDLVRQMTHDFDESDPNKLQHEWNLVNRNRQLVVAGIYYWTVEDRDGQVQIGKLVIIM